MGDTLTLARFRLDCCPHHRRTTRLFPRLEDLPPPSPREPTEQELLHKAQAKARREHHARVLRLRKELAEGRIRERGFAYCEDLPSAPGFYVYRMWASGGRCLYVGRVGDNGPRDVRKRVAEHRRAKPWWPDVARIDAADCGESGFSDEEYDQIQALGPLHNVNDTLPPVAYAEWCPACESRHPPGTACRTGARDG